MDTACIAEQKAANAVPSQGSGYETRSKSTHNSFPESFARIVAVLMRDNNFRDLTLANLEPLVIPPLMVGQFALAHARLQPSATKTNTTDLRESGIVVPVAVALWARVSANIHNLLTENLDKQPRFQPADWTSGDNIWLMTVAGDRRALPKFIQQLVETEFKGRRVWTRMRGHDGKVIVKALS